MALWFVGGIFILLSTVIPKAGGFYVAFREAFGNSMGLLARWATFAGYMAGSAAVAIACADFLGAISPIGRVACTSPGRVNCAGGNGSELDRSQGRPVDPDHRNIPETGPVVCLSLIHI